MNGKKPLSVKLKEDLYEDLEKNARRQGMNKSDLVRDAVRQYIDRENGNSYEDLWDNIPDSVTKDIKKLLKCVRDYQFVKGERPVDFSLRALNRGYDQWAVAGLEPLLETKWSSRIDKHKKKYHKARSLGLIVLDRKERKFKLSERGKKLMKTLDGGDFHPADISKIDGVDLEQLQEQEEQNQDKQATLGGMT